MALARLMPSSHKRLDFFFVSTRWPTSIGSGTALENPLLHSWKKYRKGGVAKMIEKFRNYFETLEGSLH